MCNRFHITLTIIQTKRKVKLFFSEKAVSITIPPNFIAAFSKMPKPTPYTASQTANFMQQMPIAQKPHKRYTVVINGYFSARIFMFSRKERFYGDFI